MTARSEATDPFTPGYGFVPSVWAGREAEFVEHDVLVQRVLAGVPEQARLVTGDRGVGKTAFLTVLEDEGRDAGTWVVRVAADRRSDLAADLSDLLAREVHAHVPGAALAERLTSALRQLSGVELGPGGVRVERRASPAPTGGRRRALSDALVEAGRLARASGHALLLLVDEAQNTAIPAFGALWHALQEAQNTAAMERGPRGERVRRHLPLAVYLAGLPGVLDLGKRAGVTFSERVRHVDFGLLRDPDVRAALVAFAGNADVSFDAEALEETVRLVGGHPYFLHLVGRQAWRAGTGPVITAEDVTRAREPLREDLERFYAERLRSLGEVQHRWLAAAAALDPADRTTVAVAEALGRTSAQLGSTFSGLLGHGIVRRLSGAGRFAFAVPGLDAHLRCAS